MEKTKHKNDVDGLKRYWRFFLPIVFLLAVFVKFPLRILNQETYYDMLLYGSVSLACLAAAFHIYRRFGKRG